MTTPQLSGATDVFGIPYPTLTDRLTDGAAAMQALAETVDTQLGAVIVNRDQALAAIDTEEAAALAAIDAAEAAAVAAAQAASGDLTTKVSKTGDTMTGPLGLSMDSAAVALDSAVVGGAASVRAVNPARSAYVPFRASQLYEDSVRVYSPNNPPPPGGAVIAKTIRGRTAASSYDNTGTLVTIASVNMAKTQLRYLGMDWNVTSGSNPGVPGSVELVNATTVRVSGPFANGVTGTPFDILWELTEWQ